MEKRKCWKQTCCECWWVGHGHVLTSTCNETLAGAPFGKEEGVQCVKQATSHDFLLSSLFCEYQVTSMTSQFSISSQPGAVVSLRPRAWTMNSGEGEGRGASPDHPHAALHSQPLTQLWLNSTFIWDHCAFLHTKPLHLPLAYHDQDKLTGDSATVAWNVRRHAWALCQGQSH